MLKKLILLEQEAIPGMPSWKSDLYRKLFLFLLQRGLLDPSGPLMSYKMKAEEAVSLFQATGIFKAIPRLRSLERTEKQLLVMVISIMKVKCYWDVFCGMKKEDPGLKFNQAFFCRFRQGENLYQQAQFERYALQKEVVSFDALVAEVKKIYPEIRYEKSFMYSEEAAIKELKRIWDVYVEKKKEDDGLVFDRKFIIGECGDKTLYQQAQTKDTPLQKEVGSFLGLIAEAQQVHPEIVYVHGQGTMLYTKETAIDELVRLWRVFKKKERVFCGIKFNMSFVTGPFGNRDLYLQAQLEHYRLSQCVGDFEGLVLAAHHAGHTYIDYQRRRYIKKYTVRRRGANGEKDL